jgi:hypothetical protein
MFAMQANKSIIPQVVIIMYRTGYRGTVPYKKKVPEHTPSPPVPPSQTVELPSSSPKIFFLL